MRSRIVLALALVPALATDVHGQQRLNPVVELLDARKPVFGLYAPAKTPEDVILRLNAEIRKYLSSAEAKEAFAKIGMDSAPSTPEELRERIVAEQKVFGKAVKDAKLKVE